MDIRGEKIQFIWNMVLQSYDEISWTDSVKAGRLLEKGERGGKEKSNVKSRKRLIGPLMSRVNLQK